MTLSRPLNIPSVTPGNEASLDECERNQPSAPAASPGPDLQGYFTEQVAELFKAQQALRDEFEAAIDDLADQTEALRRLRETAHEQAAEADTLLLIMTRCKAPEHLVNVTEKIFDALRDAEAQITEALAWDKRMGRRLLKLRQHSYVKRRPAPSTTTVERIPKPGRGDTKGEPPRNK